MSSVRCTCGAELHELSALPVHPASACKARSPLDSLEPGVLLLAVTLIEPGTRRARTALSLGDGLARSTNAAPQAMTSTKSQCTVPTLNLPQELGGISQSMHYSQAQLCVPER